MSINSTPLNDEQLKALEQLTHNLEEEQAIWLNGYIQGLTGKATPVPLQAYTAETETTSGVTEEILPLTVLYGTHTGRSKLLAEDISQKADAKNIDCQIFPMDDYKTKTLKYEKNLLVIVSTHGEGEPPEMAEDFHAFMTGKRAPKLQGLNYSVLALGDKSYKHFCQTGIDLDQALKKTGATELTPIVTCDVDFEDDAARWMENALEELSKHQSTPANSNQPGVSRYQKTVYSRKNPFEATVLEKVRVTGRESDKEVYHMELSLEDSGIVYEPGDALGVIARNPDPLVDNILATLNDDGSEVIETHAGKVPIKEALKHHYETTILTRDIISKYSAKTGDKKVKAILEDDQKLEEYLYGHDVLDLLQEFPTKLTPIEFLELLRPLPPRLYSICSSQASVENEVHITVSRVQYENKGRWRVGACSAFLADQLDVDDKALIYIEKNHNFRLPANGDPIIMVGAGTGIAPYRAFLQQRESENKKGKSWLFFGDRRFSSDFLYQVEWQKHLDKGHLEKIDLAFSRDQESKIYVQHKLKDQRKKLFKWLEQGAYFYLCGDMKYMAKDVQATLLEIIEKEGGMTNKKAKEYFKKLKKEKRFQADVY